MEIFNTIIRFFQAGGVFMYPILVLLALGSAIVIERTVYLFGSTMKGDKLWLGVKKAMSAGKIQDAAKQC
ncbi:MAG TPA: MotA/TolQ/ExbB proton channel family protein, partial [Nitrospiria bacterium]